MSLFQKGNHILASGDSAPWKIECDALGDEDWTCLAMMLFDRLWEPFGEVIGVPTGGLPLAEAMEPYATEGCARILLVDDVYTTGQTIRTMRADLLKRYFYARYVDMAVVFSRHPDPFEVTTLFAMTCSTVPTEDKALYVRAEEQDRLRRGVTT